MQAAAEYVTTSIPPGTSVANADAIASKGVIAGAIENFRNRRQQSLDGHDMAPELTADDIEVGLEKLKALVAAYTCDEARTSTHGTRTS